MQFTRPADPMARTEQVGLFNSAVQGELLEAPAKPAYRPNLDKIPARDWKSWPKRAWLGLCLGSLRSSPYTDSSSRK
jgi:hypothetical protein